MPILRTLTPKEDQAVRDVLDGIRSCQQVREEADAVEWIRISHALHSHEVKVSEIH